MKKVLVVDDDEILRNGMCQILADEGFEVDEAENGRVAVEILKTKNFQLVVADFEMPQMDGVQLCEYVREKTKSRTLIMSELSTALQARQAHQLGIDAFLRKPFTREDFARAVSEALNANTGGILEAREPDYIEVPITDFVTGSILQVDLYISISSHKFLKIAARGGALAQDRVEAYLKKGVRTLFMTKKDFASYVGFNITLAQRAHSAARIACAKKLRLTMHLTGNLISQLRGAGIDRQQLAEASGVVLNAVELVASSPDTLKLLESMEVDGSIPAHAIATSIWSCLIAKHLGWTGQTTFFKVAICSLFHDVGNKEIEESIEKKARFEMSRQEVKLFEGHTLRGREILQSVPGMFEDAVIVAAQHHELYRGGGYPYGLRFQQIHPVARLVTLADRLCDLLRYGGSDLGLEGAFMQISQCARDFDPDYFKALKNLMAARSQQKAMPAA